MLSITTDYVADKGSPEPYLKRIANAGFSHVHWCHQWNTDFLYSVWEVRQIRHWLDDFGLRLLDLHASHGVEKKWTSPVEYERLAGLDLVRNRIEMTAELGAGVLILHYGNQADDPATRDAHFAVLRKSLDELEAFAHSHSVRIALENGRLLTIREVLSGYSPEYLGLCYDSGHANLCGDLERLEPLKDRLISVHLHDNDGASDQHKPLFSGSIDWERLARIVASSSYTGCVSMELSMKNAGIEDEDVFLHNAYDEGTRFSQMIAEKQKPQGMQRT